MLKRLRLFILIVVLIQAFSFVNVNACLQLYNGTDTNIISSEQKKELESDVRYWRQGRIPYTGADKIYNNPDSDTIANAACSHFAMSYALVKMGILNPKNGDTPLTHIENARKYNAFKVSWGYFDFSQVGKLYSDVTYEGQDDNVSSLGRDDALAYVKGKINEGYYVVACVVTPVFSGGHCIFFDGVNDDGTMSIGDSAGNGLTWEDSYGKQNTTISYLELLKCKGKEFKDQPSIYDDNVLRDKNSSDIETENITYRKIVDEWDLKGMPNKSNLTSTMKNPSLVDRSNLTMKEIQNIESIKEIKDADNLSIFSIMKSIISFIGLLLIVYAILLMLAYLFDRVNSFIDVSMVSLLTLGNIKLIQKEDMQLIGVDKEKERGYVTTRKLFFIIGLLIFLGAMMMSGVLSYLIYLVMSKISFN